jgi:hypothetical protein
MKRPKSLTAALNVKEKPMAEREVQVAAAGGGAPDRKGR